MDSIQTKFLAPLSQNLILFENIVRNDKNILKCVNRIIYEYFAKELGFELVIKSQIYDLIVLLLRGYIKKIYTEKEFNLQLVNLQRFHSVLEYIDKNFTEIALACGFTDSNYFSRVFKKYKKISPLQLKKKPSIKSEF